MLQRCLSVLGIILLVTSLTASLLVCAWQVMLAGQCAYEHQRLLVRDEGASPTRKCSEAKAFLTVTYECVLLSTVFILLCLLINQSTKVARLTHRLENLQNYLKDREQLDQVRKVKVPIEEKKPMTQNYTFHVGCQSTESRAKPAQPPPSPPVRQVAYSPATHRRNLAISGPEITLMENSLSSRLASPGNAPASDLASQADNQPTPFRPAYQQQFSPRSPLVDIGRRSFEDTLRDTQNRMLPNQQQLDSADANAAQSEESHSLQAQSTEAMRTFENAPQDSELEVKPSTSSNINYTKIRDFQGDVGPLPSRFPLMQSHRTFAIHDDYENSTIH